MLHSPSPNFLNDQYPQAPATTDRSAPRRRRIHRAVRTIAVTVGVVFLVLAWTTRSSDPNVLRALRDSATVRSLWSLLRSPNTTLDGERGDRISVLLLGIGGNDHDGPLLTDTILLASIQPSTRRTTFVSIPRDLFLPIADGTWRKANTINAYAESAPGAGAFAIRDALAAALDLRIPYVVRVDFRGFAGLVDAIGGVDVDVERTIDDPRYPIAGAEAAEPYDARFERLVIPAGRQRFDGSRALQYVRSRHAIGIEGSDFARGRRQQRLLLAIRDRLLNNGGLANPKHLLALAATWREHVVTNLAPPELYALASRTYDLSGTSTHLVFTDGPQGELVARIVDGAYVLEPKEGSFERIRALIADAFMGREETSHTATITAPAAPAAENVLTIEVWNGTNISGLASRAAAALELDGFQVTAIRNAPTRTVSRTVVYRRGHVAESLVAPIAERFQGESIATFPALPNADESPADILIILGASSAELPVTRIQPQV